MIGKWYIYVVHVFRFSVHSQLRTRPWDPSPPPPRVVVILKVE